MLAVEFILLFFEDYFYSTGAAVLGFVIGSVILAPLITLIHIRQWHDRHWLARITQDLYLALALFYGCAVGLISQREGDATHIYFVFAIGISAVIYSHSIDRLILLGSSYLAFFLLLPVFQSDSRVVNVLRINSLITNVLASLIGQMVYQMQIRSFLDHQTISAQNANLLQQVRLDQMTHLLNHESAISQPGTETWQAAIVADRIRVNVAALRFTRPVSVTLSGADAAQSGQK